MGGRLSGSQVLRRGSGRRQARLVPKVLADRATQLPASAIEEVSSGPTAVALLVPQQQQQQPHPAAGVAVRPPSSTAAPAAAAATAVAAAAAVSSDEMGLTDVPLESTPEQRAWTALGCAAVLATLGKAAAAVAAAAASEVDPGGAEAAVAAAALGLAAGYAMADLGSGVYHWGIDNYGDARSPVFGAQIDAFQGHHRRPWTITRRGFCNNSYAIARPVALALAPLLLLPPPVPLSDAASAGGHAFLGAFLGFVLLSQQIHAWAHSKKSRLPPAVVALQDAGLLVARKMHGGHHRAPYDVNYCIVSGVWNAPLDAARVFPRLERAIFRWNGVRPRSWSGTLPEWVQETAYFEDGTETDVDG